MQNRSLALIQHFGIDRIDHRSVIQKKITIRPCGFSIESHKHVADKKLNIGRFIRCGDYCLDRWLQQRGASNTGRRGWALVYVSDLEKSAAKALSEERERFYHYRSKSLRNIVDAVLLTREAKKSGVSVGTLLDQEVHSKIMPITDDEIEVFYSSNKSRLGMDLKEAREQIREFLRVKKIEIQRTLYLKSLRSNSRIETYLKLPPLFRAEVPITGAPAKGPEYAPVTIVKFEDFQCPYCKQFQPTVTELLSRYNGKIRLVHKDLPLDSIHPQAHQAAEAARCADEQGKFWNYHDKLYANAPKFSTGDLTNYAKELGLNVGFFERCFASGKYRTIVKQDISDGVQLGLTGTPTFFINGREISGTQPLETFVTMIDEELRQTK
jgi:protein-disulfide isomerase